MIILRILDIGVVCDIYQIILLNQLVNHFFTQELYFLCEIKKCNLSVLAINTYLNMSIAMQWGRAYNLHNLQWASHVSQVATCSTRWSGSDQRGNDCNTKIIVKQLPYIYSHLDKMVQNRSNALGTYFRLYSCPSQYIMDYFGPYDPQKSIIDQEGHKYSLK